MISLQSLLTVNHYLGYRRLVALHAFQSIKIAELVIGFHGTRMEKNEQDLIGRLLDFRNLRWTSR